MGIDPCADAYCKDDTDAFEVVGGQDFEGTCAVVEKYGIEAIVTAATDKPLVMMARIAEKYGFPFFSVDTARWSTDKFLMKERFKLGGITHARGRLISRVEDAEGLVYPVIVKPRDNSGSRGVKLCRNYDGKSEVIQFTEKKTTEFPYNVELGHKQPALLTDEQKDAIREIVAKIGSALRFENCPSHTELKINDRGIFVIETSPRLGGDFITSTLVPLSTGINMEDQLLNLSLGEEVNIHFGHFAKAAGVHFFCFPIGRLIKIDHHAFTAAKSWPGMSYLSIKLHEGDMINQITSSLNRYGEFIVQSIDSDELDSIMTKYEKEFYGMISIKEV